MNVKHVSTLLLSGNSRLPNIVEPKGGGNRLEQDFDR